MKRFIQLNFISIFTLYSTSLFAQSSVSITASKDNSIYSGHTSNSNGSGIHLFTGTSRTFDDKRALVYFDLNEAVPAGSTVDSVVLTLTLNKFKLSTPTPVTVYRLNKSWGEGSSDGGTSGGQGATATAGEATWSHAAYDTDAWSVAGGDFESEASAEIFVSTTGKYDWRGSGLLADVTAWLADGSSNHGWILIGEEGVKQSAKRYSSRESTQEADRPTLTIHYTDQVTGISEADLSDPLLFKAFPNPFSEELTIVFNLEEDERIELGVFNLLGQQVETIVKGIESAGRYRFTWDGTDRSGKSLPQGMYYVILTRGSEQEVFKILRSR